MASLSFASYGQTQPIQDQSGAESRQRKSQTRQLLSCTKCRERKVKCDRTKPCSACCARGHPKECEFIVGEGNDYSPIQQSYEIRKLRQENQRLKARLRAAQLPHTDDEDDEEPSTERRGSKSGSRLATARQRAFKTTDRIDNLYFGTPGLANIVSDFANLQIGTQSLTHTVPKGKDVYAIGYPTYPFPVVPNCSSSVELLRILPEERELFRYLEDFQHRAQSCSFPHTPEEATTKEVERFLADAEHNAEMAPDMLALIFVTLATGLQMGQFERNGRKWNRDVSIETRKKGDSFLAASMQALRNASFMNQPTLLGIQTLIMMGPYLTNSGRFLDAWTLFGTTIRLAHSVGLHRNPKLLDPVPPLPECSVRQTLWWWMLHMDQQYAVTLGRPLGISGVGDCPPPQPLTTDPTMLRLSEFVDYFTIDARQILGSADMMSVSKIDEFTDKIIHRWDTMPAALQFNESWLQAETKLPDWPLQVVATMLYAKVQSLLILLNRQRVERTQSAISRDASPPMNAATSSRSQSSYYRHRSPGSFSTVDPSQPSTLLRGRDLVLNCSMQILKAFMFFHTRNPGVLICWTMGQQAFNACMILLLDAWETENEHNLWLVDQVFVVFRELEKHSVHTLANIAVQRISDMILRLGQRYEERRNSVATTVTSMSSRRSSSTTQQMQPSLALDTATMSEWSSDTVMGNTGMFLIEDPGLQAFTPSSFQPLGWNMLDMGGLPSRHSYPPTPHMRSPTTTTVPVSQVAAAPFPLVATAPFMPSPITIPVTNSPFAVGLQPRMPTNNPRKRHGSSSQQHHSAFTPLNANGHQYQANQRYEGDVHSSPLRSPQPFSPPSGSQANGDGPRGVHRLDKVPRSQQRRR